MRANGLVGAAALLAAAVASGDTPREGRLVEGLHCESDASQTYTLYLPRAYTQARRWPALLIFDPRGRSMLAAELFREAAETYGWILVSSNDTRSDGPPGPNAKAIQALWPELHLRYATDPQRIYAAGFSGGGMLAFELGRRASSLAGVIASGARWVPDQFKQRIDFPSFGAAGDTDFNNSPMRAVHARLREWGTPERLVIFEGRHQWMPAELAGQAIAWMELMAMKRELRPLDADFVARQLSDELARARRLEAEGHRLEALRALESTAATFAGLADVATAGREAARVEAIPATRAERREEERWDRFERAALRRLDEACGKLLDAEPPLPSAAFRGDLRFSALQRHARAPAYEGVVGRRLLETVATQAGYYLSRDLLARKDHLRALAALTVATEARPDRPFYWYSLACVQARLGGRREALDALERAVAAGFTDRAAIADDEDLASLREEERFKALVREPSP